MRLADVISVTPRFTRAINLERDANDPDALDGYIITSTAEMVLGRIAATLEARAIEHRAWTLTGPYGSGKSAFALYLANLLGPNQSVSARKARALLRTHNPSLAHVFRLRREGFCPVLVTGASEPLAPALLRACVRDVKRYCHAGRPPTILRELDTLAAQAAEDQPLGSRTAASLVELAEWLRTARRSRGLAIIIDELGKFLEFTAMNPIAGDIYVLQQLAEATARFNEAGLIVVTVLHQAFEEYARGLRTTVRDEWAKVQGRFEDVAFQEPPEEVLGLLAHAIQHTHSRTNRALQQEARRIAEQSSALGLVPAGMQRRDFIETLSRCAPLHPLAAISLARLCRKFGQHHRSLFTFLTSRDPAGFSEFLRLQWEENARPFYRLPMLFDYAIEAFGTTPTRGETIARWSEVEQALDRTHRNSWTEIEIIKTVGLLSTIGVTGGLRPSRDILTLALGEPATTIEKACQRLTRQSVLIYRRHAQAFALWQGSDIDIDARLQDARRKLPPQTSLAAKIAELWLPRPIVAKRHSFQSGTLRYFSMRFADSITFSKVLERPDDADGLLIYCLPNNQAEREMLLELAQSSFVRDRLDVLVAIPGSCDALNEAVTELERICWVELNTPELQGDAVARREIRARIAAAKERVSIELQQLFGPTERGRTQWYHRGLLQTLTTPRSLSVFLSSICDVVYPHTPRLHNELLNRRTLSSAAAAARRNLLSAMLTRAGEAQLGISGTPPEKSMYASVLAATGIHRQESLRYAFGPPSPASSLTPVWQTIEEFFRTCELRRRGVGELFEVLQKPPFGLKIGVIPVLFCAALLVHDNEIALYEDHAFIPELTPDTFERLVRSADKFELRRFQVIGVRREVFRKLSGLLSNTEQGRGEHLISVVRPLYRFFNRLPSYVRQTTNVSPRTAAVRDALFHATDPDVLLFEALPRACGFEPFPPSQARLEEVEQFFETLRTALSELQRSYDDLLADLQRLLFRAFDVPDSRGRELLRGRAQSLSEHALDGRLRAFILHLTEELDHVAWIESLASMVIGKAPKMWNETDRARYEIALSELARNFRHMEALVFELGKNDQADVGELLRIGITDRFSKELEAVILVKPEQCGKLAEAMVTLDRCLEQLGLDSTPTLALASLATTARKILAELNESQPKTTASTKAAKT